MQAEADARSGHHLEPVEHGLDMGALRSLPRWAAWLLGALLVLLWWWF